ncbi:MAG: hypothetical protein ABI612_21720 [Betaproteobacteria bacterium]
MTSTAFMHTHLVNRVNYRRLRVWSLLSMAALLTTGCGLGLSRPAPVKHYYMLEVSTEQSVQAPLFTVPLKVVGFEVAPPFEDRAFVIRLEEQRYEYDFYNEFFVSPRAMVTSRVSEWLATRGVFSAVLPASSTLDAPYALEGLVTAMYGDFRKGASAVFTMQAFVTQTHTPERRVLLERSYSHEVFIADRSADSLSKGLSQAFQDCLLDLERDLRGLQLTP